MSFPWPDPNIFLWYSFCLSLEIVICCFFFLQFLFFRCCTMDHYAVSLSSLFFMYSSSLCIDASSLCSMLANSLTFSSLNTYRISRSSFGRKALCIVMLLLVLGSIFWVLTLSILRIIPIILQRWAAQVFILWWNLNIVLGFQMIDHFSKILFFNCFFHLHLF